ncbi:MAG: THxN family PEP-CTERM protein [Azoarcus sp.]|jgi:hypothetical protein|nr:THxN family PEP-CTERM protein [Azoarcus sp.]
MMKKGICKLVAASVLACAASASQAMIVEAWKYTVDMNWVTDATVFSENTAPATYSTTSTPTLLSWGHKMGLDDYLLGSGAMGSQMRSSLKITSPRGEGWFYTGSGVSSVNIFRHTNNSLAAASPALKEATLRVSVNLTPFFNTVPVETLTKDFKVYFYETPNIGGTCSWGPCNDDLFAFVVMPRIYDVFTYDGYEYTFNYFQTSGPNAIMQFGADVCSELSGGVLTTSCYGFKTAESAQTTIQFGFSVTATPVVPEPETYVMLLAGLGLVGAVVSRRRDTIRHS